MMNTTPQRRMIRAGEVDICALVAGEGETVLLVHGFPGIGWSWRHQLEPLARNGFRAVAVDLRGYGASSRPVGTPAYAIDRHVEDLAGVLDALEVERAHVVGQDFGASYSWALAQRRPDRVRSVSCTVPNMSLSAATRPTEQFAAAQRFLHLHYFQQLGRAEGELTGEHLSQFLTRLLWALSGEGDFTAVYQHPSGTGYLEALPEAPALPWHWLTEADRDELVAQYRNTVPVGDELIGPLAGYRNADATWESAREWSGTPITARAGIIMGELDPVRGFFPEITPASHARNVPNLEEVVFIPGAGHHVQQEQPAAYTAALLEFLGRG